MATRIDLSDFEFFPIAALDSAGSRLAVAELPVVALFDTNAGRKLGEFRWLRGHATENIAAAPTAKRRRSAKASKPYEEPLYETAGIPVVIEFSPDGRHLFVGCSHHSGALGANDCYLFDVSRPGASSRFVSIEKAMRANGIASRDYNYNDPAAALFTPDGEEIAVAGSFGALFFSVSDENTTRALALPDVRNKIGTPGAGRESCAITFRDHRGALAWCDSLWLFDREDLGRVRELRSPGRTRLAGHVAFRDDDTLVVGSRETVEGIGEEHLVHAVDLRTDEWRSIRLPAALKWLSRDGRSALCSNNHGHDLIRVDLLTQEAVAIPRATSAGRAASRLLSISADGVTIARTIGGLELGADATAAVITRRVRR